MWLRAVRQVQSSAALDGRREVMVSRGELVRKCCGLPSCFVEVSSNSNIGSRPSEPACS